MAFDPNWPHGHTTRDNRKVTIYCTDAPGAFPVHGRIEHRGDPVSWRFDGRYDGASSSLDLINAPAPRDLEMERAYAVYLAWSASATSLKATTYEEFKTLPLSLVSAWKAAAAAALNFKPEN